MTDPVWIHRTDFVEIWHCDQPDVYLVIDQWWNEDHTERHIYQVEACEVERVTCEE